MTIEDFFPSCIATINMLANELEAERKRNGVAVSGPSYALTDARNIASRATELYRRRQLEKQAPALVDALKLWRDAVNANAVTVPAGKSSISFEEAFGTTLNLLDQLNVK